MANSTTSIRRRIRPTGPTTSTIYSQTRDGKAVKHQIRIDPATGRVSCTCEHFQYRLAGKGATVYTPDLWCKHLLRFAQYLVRKTGAKSGVR